jgi:hypothetical protein
MMTEPYLKINGKSCVTYKGRQYVGWPRIIFAYLVWLKDFWPVVILGRDV